MKGQATRKNKAVRMLAVGLATVGLSCWAVLLSIALFEKEPSRIPSDLGGITFDNSLDFVIKISGLFLLFPVVFNLLAFSGGLLLCKEYKTLSLNFVYSVIYEFGLLWAILMIGYFCLY